VFYYYLTAVYVCCVFASAILFIFNYDYYYIYSLSASIFSVRDIHVLSAILINIAATVTISVGSRYVVCKIEAT
jgi:hypothetical protein